MHSPFGNLYPIIEKTGWTLNEIMWKHSWAKIKLIIADQPAFTKAKAGTKVKAIPITGKEMGEMVNKLFN